MGGSARVLFSAQCCFEPLGCRGRHAVLFKTAQIGLSACVAQPRFAATLQDLGAVCLELHSTLPTTAAFALPVMLQVYTERKVIGWGLHCQKTQAGVERATAVLGGEMITGWP